MGEVTFAGIGGEEEDAPIATVLRLIRNRPDSDPELTFMSAAAVGEAALKDDDAENLPCG